LNYTIAARSWLPPALIAALVVGLWQLKNILRRKRERKLRDIAQRLGFSFQGEDWVRGTRAPQLETPLFERKNGEIRNIMTGTREGLAVSFFDYSYGQGRSHRQQTLATFSQDVWLPQFEVSPQVLLGGIASAFLHKKIHFESHPEFSKRFRLVSVDPENTRKLFTPGMLSFLGSFDPKSKWCLEGSGVTLVIYRSGKTVGTEQFPFFVDETIRIAKSFFSLCGLKQRPSVLGLVADKSS
jgi:hypothetical protein